MQFRQLYLHQADIKIPVNKTSLLPGIILTN